VLLIFGSKLLGLFSMSAFHSFLNTDLHYRQRQAVVTLKIHNFGLDRLCAIHFWPFSTLVWVSTHCLGTTGLDQLTHRYLKLWQQVCLKFTPGPWWESIVASFSQIHNYFHALCRLRGSNMCKLVWKTCVTFAFHSV